MAARKRKTQSLKVVTEEPASAPGNTPETGPKIAKQEYVIRAVESLLKHPRNPKKGNVAAIGDSIEKNDFYGAAVIQKSTGFIIAGNHRYEAAIEKGLKEIPVIVVDVDDATAERILLGDNRIAEMGGYDDSVLQKLLEDRTKNGGLHGTGYDDTYLKKLQEKNKPKEATPDKGATRHVHHCPKCGHEWSSKAAS